MRSEQNGINAAFAVAALGGPFLKERFVKILTITRLLPAVTLACALGAAPVAMAQSQGGTMAPMSASHS
ncbi:MAG: hypothetical protein B7Z81_02815, partial [Acidocella sp. 20-61-6]